MDKIKILVYLIFAGIAGASIYSYYVRTFIGGFVRKLAKETEETGSKTLKELGYKALSALLLKLSLTENSSLRKYVRVKYTEDEIAVLKEKGIQQEYIIPEENKEKVLKRYDGSEVKFGMLILALLVCIAGAVICAKVIPIVADLVGGTGSIFGNDDTVIGEMVEETVLTEPEN